ncbi:class I SAM-dependent methyltransferase [Ferrimonas marina]|uniref:Tellurite resistance protein TehB n=1 Tax=Ferrimonas marina TaxID=299255 RepID=A0A1M5ZFJ8_9GAMM|nr:class I SAM-dependent methyltransferase [Ferrimonas marina]SHI23007.1 Tellurite resistance protein TehB [Ferrimonas marina]
MHGTGQPSPLLTLAAEPLAQCPPGPVLDLACGAGRNGLALARAGLPVWFADRNRDALDKVQQQLNGEGLSGVLWHRDLEQPHRPALAGKRFAAILVFNYLHRPLLAELTQALLPGGLLIYETFLRQQATLGRPRNPDFLLKPGELQQAFASWQTIHYREGKQVDPERYSAQLVTRKPL